MPSTENGFSLIEVLISVFVLTIGVIGAAGMQLVALRTAQQSVFQTRALHLATEMADNMRANLAQMRLEESLNPYLGVDYQSSSSERYQIQSDCYGTDAYCDTGQLARFDIGVWLQRVSSELPAGRVRICRDAAPWNNVNQRFNWDCAASAASAASIVIKIGWQEKSSDNKATQNSQSSAPGIVLTVAPYAK